MRKILILALGFLFGLSTSAYADTVTAHTTYGVNSQVTSTTLNGNFNALANEVNAGLDNSNADTAEGFRFYEKLGSLPSVGTQGRLVYLTTDDLLYRDNGTAFGSFLNAGTTATISAVWTFSGANTHSGNNTFSGDNTLSGTNTFSGTVTGAVSAYVGSFTRDSAVASGTQAVTGVGFQPKAVIFLMNQDGTSEMSFGVSDSTTDCSVADDHPNSVSTYNISTTYSIADNPGSANNYLGQVTTLGSDGFTVTWTKNNNPTGTLTVAFLAIG